MTKDIQQTFRECIENSKPYFGPVMGAFQGDPIRHYHMDKLVAREAVRLKGRPLKILEVGSWAGGSAITWGSAIKRHNDGRGIVVCVDPWHPYFEAMQYAGLADLSTYHEMQKALEEDKIYSLFLHNIRSSSLEDIVLPIRGESDLILPMLQEGGFDLIFVDGAHDYASVSKDLKNSCRLVVEGGIICGDDLELQLSDTDRNFGKENRHLDYVCDPARSTWYHPGVTWGVAEQLGPVSERDGFWGVRKNQDNWILIDIPVADRSRLHIPEHLAHRVIAIENNFHGFNLLLLDNSYHAIAGSLRDIDLTSIEPSTLNEYATSGKYLAGATLDDVKNSILSKGLCGLPELVEENFHGFNILKYEQRYHAIAMSLGSVDFISCSSFELEEYGKWGKYLASDSIEILHELILSSGFAGTPLLLEENVCGFNIVKYENKFYALSLSLGPFDLTSATPEEFSRLERQGVCHIAESLSNVKHMLEGKPLEAKSLVLPAEIQSTSVEFDMKKQSFSRELCLRYDGGVSDQRFVSALFNSIPLPQGSLAIQGEGKVGRYILSLMQNIPGLSVDCIIDEDNAGGVLDGIPVINPGELPASITTVFVAETRWLRIMKMVNELPKRVRVITLDTLAQLNPSAVPAHAWVPRVESIYPIAIPDISFLPGMDLILIDLPARSIAQMPAGFAYVHNALKRTPLKCQTLDLDIILYHRYHSHRILDGLPEIITSSGHKLPEDPWQPVHYLEWENQDFIEYFREDIDEIVNGLIAAQPRIIAFSLQQVNLRFTKEVVKGIRSGLPEVKIVVGGMSCLQTMAAKIVFPDADYTVVGEADLIIGPLTESLVRGECPRNLPGVWSRYDDPDREFTSGELPMQLDELDFPHYEWTNIQLYRNWNGYQLTPIIGSRGCSWSRCSFCGERFKWRVRTPELVVDEMEWLYNQGFTDFVFNESNLHGDPLLTERMCDEIIRRGMKISMTAQLRCHQKVDERYYRKLHQAGFNTLRFGVDGASVNTLKLQKKGYTKEMILRNVQDAKRAGIHVQINLVIGIPGETEEDIDESIAFIGEMKDHIGVVEFINPLMLFRGSDYWESPEKYGIVFHSNREELYNNYLVAIPDTEWHSTSPYIDKEVRYSRFVRVVNSLRTMGVPLGDFANYTSEAVTSRQDLANTHNKSSDDIDKQRADKNQVTGATCREKMALLIPENCTGDELSQLLNDARFKDAVLLSSLTLPTVEIYGRRVIMLESVDSNLEALLQQEKFDLVIFPCAGKLGTISIEAFVGKFCRRALVVFHNGKSRIYENDDFNRLLYNAAYLRSMFSHVPDLKNNRVLEVGCSDRLAADIVANEHPGFIVAIDAMPCQPSKFDDPRITCVQMDAHRLEFDNSTFELTYSIATLEHCKDPFTVMQEMKRVLRPGGYAYIQVAPLYCSPFGHHMFGYFDDFPWIHLRKSKAQIIEHCHSRSLDKSIEANTGQTAAQYVEGMINPQHVNGKTYSEYRLEEFMAADDIEVVFFNRSYEGKELLTPEILAELSAYAEEDLVSHGYELVFRKKH